MSNSKFEQIIAISGQPGLFKLISKSQTRVIVKSLLDGRQKSMPLNHNLNLLSEIRVYGLHEEVSLEDIFDKMLHYESGKKTRVQPKAPKEELEAYFFEVFQDYDEDRVYASNIKKIIQWYNLLLQEKIIALTEEKPEPTKQEAKEAPKNDSEV